MTVEPIAELRQRDGLFSRYAYTLGPDGIAVDVRMMLNRYSFTLPVEVIFERPREEQEGSRKWFIATIVLAVFSLVCLLLRGVPSNKPVDPWAWAIWGGLAVIAGGIYWQTRKHWIFHGRGSAALAMLRNKPSRQEVDRFLDAVRQRARELARERFLLAEKDGDAAMELQRLNWLREQEIISASEYEVRKQRLLGEGPSPIDPRN